MKIISLRNQKMNVTDAKASWAEQKEKLRKMFSSLRDSDLYFDESKKEEMLGKLQLKFGKTKEELLRVLASE
ncbi:MAG: general stress protein CsbD [Bacteroidota bacterium]